ncbi:hypothetical protein ACF053_29970 [Streptomyces kanasensis]|uniref:hypothetical protein n=1 Tax=Streptomyces kanasensis TaxID=936756 RepID=UPI0036FC1CFB
MPQPSNDADPSSTLRPKWVPLRKDQYQHLADLARDLQDARTTKTERITENTLIRVAIDIITTHPELLAGNTEDELRSHALMSLRTPASTDEQSTQGGGQ